MEGAGSSAAQQWFPVLQAMLMGFTLPPLRWDQEPGCITPLWEGNWGRWALGASASAMREGWRIAGITACASLEIQCP